MVDLTQLLALLRGLHYDLRVEFYCWKLLVNRLFGICGFGERGQLLGFGRLLSDGRDASIGGQGKLARDQFLFAVG